MLIVTGLSNPISILFLITAFFWLILPLAIPFSRRISIHWICALLFGFGGLSCFALACCILYTHTAGATLYLPFALGFAQFTLRFDMLSGWFIGIIGLTAIAISPYLPKYMLHLKARVNPRIFWPVFSCLMASMLMVTVSANVLTFLICWEAMSITSFALVASDHEPRATRQAALIYLAATRIGTGFLMAGFLWTYGLTGSWAFSDWHLHGASALGPGLLILAGLGVKAGMWPFHLWLPIAHPAAPAPVSAVMSGVMVKIAIAIIIRLFLIDSAFVNPVFGYTIFGFGAISAFWGVLFALLQHDLKRLLAYHTVENIGLILMGTGVAVAARNHGLVYIAQIAAAGAMFHALNHALFKSSLFLGAGAIDAGCGTRELTKLGGLGRRMPWTYAFFVLAAAAICGLPPLNGFASEWLLYQSLLRTGFSPIAPVFRFVALLSIGWIGLIGALATACFIKATGVAFQGRPRSESAKNAIEAGWGMRVSQSIFASACLALGLAAPVALRVLQPIVAPIGGHAEPVTSVWTLPLGLTIFIMAVTVAAGALWMKSAERRRPARTYITWECGFGPVTARMQVNPSSFAQPIARMFGSLYRYAEILHVDEGRSKHFPKGLHAETTTVSLLEKKVYNPLSRLLLKLGGRILYLQEGSIHRYLMMMFLTLLALLIVGGYSR